MTKLYKETTIKVLPTNTGWLSKDHSGIMQIELVNGVALVEYIERPYTTLTPIETLHTNHQPKKMTKAELVQYLYDNYYDANDNIIDLSELDFTKFNCGVDICGMEVNGNLGQAWQSVSGNLHQDYQNVKGKIYQNEVGDDE